VLAALLAPVLGAEPASAGRFVDRTVTALRSGPIYVDPHAEYKPYRSEVQELRRRIRSSHAGPLHVAVLPARAAKEGGGSARALAGVLRRRLGRQGTYAVVAGADFGAASSDLPPGEAERLARAAYSAHRDQGVGPTLLDFVDRVGDAKSGRSPGGGGGGGIPTGAVVAILAAVAAVAALGALVRRRRRTAAVRPVRRAARDDLASFAADARELEPAAASPAAAAAYGAALDAYERAEHACDRSRSPEDLRAVASALARGRNDLARARALLAADAAPAPRRPCFFDPRHGPAAREVEWREDGHAPRRVAACEADAERVERGADPDVRHVLVHGRPVPYWDAPPEFGPWIEGHYGEAQS